MSIKEIALKANGNSRACGKCKMRRKCNLELSKICRDAFVEGFEKGYEQNKKEQKQKISSILHDASEYVSGKDIFIFFRDVRGDEDAAFILSEHVSSNQKNNASVRLDGNLRK